jgi:DNA anti-recombination protein RmuC
MEVDVEILDVTEDEARTLLLTIDPMAARAQTQEQIHQRLQEITPTNDPDLQALWQAQAEQLLDPGSERGSPDPALTEQFLVLVTCRDETEQLELLGRLKEEGRECKALLA